MKKRGGGGKSFSHAEGGQKKSFRVAFLQKLEALAILKGGDRKFLPWGGGREHFLPCLEGGGGAQQVFGPTIFPFCSPPSP